MLWDLQVILEWSRIFVETGKYLGQYPPVLYMMVYPFSRLDLNSLIILYTAAFLFILFYYEKENGIYALMFYPVLHCWIMGQLTIFIYWAWKSKSSLLYVFSSLKPHVFILLLPDIIKEKKVVETFCGVAVLYGFSFALYPNWFPEMLANINILAPLVKFPFSPAYLASEISPLIYFMIVAFLPLLTMDNLKYYLAWINFGLVPYDYVLFIDKYTKYLIIPSWVIALSGNFEWFYFLLLFWILKYYRNTKHERI